MSAGEPQRWRWEGFDLPDDIWAPDHLDDEIRALEVFLLELLDVEWPRFPGEHDPDTADSYYRRAQNGMFHVQFNAYRDADEPFLYLTALMGPADRRPYRRW